MSSEPFDNGGSIRERMRLTSVSLGATLERLASGVRINSASDDSAGLMVADALRTQGTGLEQAYRNINDSISRVNVADDAIGSMRTILTRIDEIASLSMSSVLNASQRGSLDDEAQALRDEYNRMVDTATFNGSRLFTSTGLSQTVQAGFLGTSDHRISYSLAAYGNTVGGTGSYQAAQTFAAGDYGYGVVAADIDGDGNEDIVQTSILSENIGVRLGNGDGTFQANVSIGFAARNIAVEDFNSDGIADILATGNSGTVGVMLFRGNGDGTFQSGVSLNSDVSILSEVSVADFTGDGILDFVHHTTQSTVYVGAGDGTFSAGQSLAMSGAFSTRPSAVGDVDSDGDQDFVLSTNSGTFLYRNDGGTFSSATTILSGPISSQELGDIDNDGDLDLVVGYYTADSAVRVMTNNGSGTFTLAATLTGLADTEHIKILDVNSDGENDIVVASDTGSFGIGTFAGNGDGTFGTVVTRTSATGIQIFDTSDFNGDGALDAIGASPLGDNLHLFLGTTRTLSREHRVRHLDQFSILGVIGARDTRTLVTAAQDELTMVQGATAAATSRLSSAATSASFGADEARAAEDRVRSIDYATEVAESTRLQILADQQTAILAQANQQQRLVLKLLSDG